MSYKEKFEIFQLLRAQLQYPDSRVRRLSIRFIHSFIQQILVEHLPSAKDWELGSEHTAVSENGTVADPTLPSSSQVER